MSDAPTVPYWHLFVGADGVSRQTRCRMTRFEMQAIQPEAAPQWQGEKHHDGMTVMVTVLTPDASGAGVTTTVRLPPLPPNTMFATGTTLGELEAAMSVSDPSGVRSSSTVNAMAPVAVSSSVV